MSISFQLPTIKAIFGSPLEELPSKYQLVKMEQAATCSFAIEALESAAAAGSARVDEALFGRCVVLAANLPHLAEEELKGLEASERMLISDATFQLFSRTISGAETLFSKKQRILKKAAILTNGLGEFFKEAILIKDSYWQEALLADHPYGADIGDYFDVWSMSKKITYSFEDFMSLKAPYLRPTSSVHYLTEAEKKGMEIAVYDVVGQ